MLFQDKHKTRYFRLSILFCLLLTILFLSSCTSTTSPAAVDIPLSEAIDLSKSNNISSASINTGNGEMTLIFAGASETVTDTTGNQVTITDGSQLTTNTGSLNLSDLQQLGFVLPASYSTTSNGSNTIGSILSFLLPAILIFVMLFFLFRASRAPQSDAMNYSRSKARLVTADKPKVTFADIAGADEAKEELQEVVDFLKNRWRFQAIGATIPKGILLIGPPGTGKTLLARALAGEAGVPFMSISGSEFVEMFVGVGAARVRDLFDRAKHSAPCIVFIDEIDAVGRTRAGNVPGSHEEREQTLNQILVEMDGFDQNTGVIVLAATNRPDVLDQALLRPGRFDRRVTLDRPDTRGRAAILMIHAKNKTMDKSVNLETIAKETHGFSGADLAELVNEAAILAVRRHKTTIGMNELEDSIDRVLAGPERKSLRIRPRDKELTAYHEAGHALVAHVLPNVDPVHKISIVSRGTMGGYTRLLQEDRYFMTESYFKDTLATLVAGHTAEEMIFNEVSTGPHSDIRQATDIARKMITDYGMSKKLGLRTFGQTNDSGYYGPEEHRDYGNEVAKQIDEEVHDIIEDAHNIAHKILEGNKARLAHIAKKLLENETLESSELQAAFNEPIPETENEKKQPVSVA